MSLADTSPEAKEIQLQFIATQINRELLRLAFFPTPCQPAFDERAGRLTENHRRAQ
jgi:hypothetical protein